MRRTYIWIGIVSLAALLAAWFFYMNTINRPHPVSPANEAPLIETQEVTTTEGLTLLVAPFDPSMGRTLMQHKTWKPAILKLLSTLIRPQDRIIHLGANTGFLDLYMARFLRAEDKGMVMAFEGVPSLVTLLNMNIQKNGLEKLITVTPVAVAQKESQLSFCYEDIDPKLTPSSPLCHTLRAVPLDSLVLSPPNLFVAAIEGSEVGAILGAQKLLERGGYPPLILEWNPSLLKAKNADVGAFVAFMKRAGYKVYEIAGNRQTLRLIPLSISALEREATKRDLLIRRE